RNGAHRGAILAVHVIERRVGLTECQSRGGTDFTGNNWSPPGTLRRTPERTWRRGDSNPRPRMTGWVFYGRILLCISPQASRRQEGPSASPAAMSGGGHQAKPSP